MKVKSVVVKDEAQYLFDSKMDNKRAEEIAWEWFIEREPIFEVKEIEIPDEDADEVNYID